MDFGQIWYLRKGLFKENPTPSVARSLEKNSLRTSDITGKWTDGHGFGILVPSYSGWPLAGLPPYASSVLPRLWVVSGRVWSDLEGRKWVSLVNLQGFRVLYVGNHVGRLMNGCRRWILVEGSRILVVIAGPLIYLVYGCMYSSFSFSDFYQKSPHLLAVCAQSDIIWVTCTSLAVDKTSRVSESLDLNWQPL